MANKKSKEATPYHDSEGKTIHVHDYVRTTAGHEYYINTKQQAVPAGENKDGAAVELEELLAAGPVTILSIEEALQLEEKPVAVKRRGGRKPSAPKPAEEAAGASAPAAQEQAPGEHQDAASEAPEAQPHLMPVDGSIILSLIPDAELVKELRRRGWLVNAVKPAVLSL